jgi:regulator of cell morphogenesis and NO signaling
MKTLALPLLLYVAMTLGVPLLDGVPADGAFLQHAAVVLGGAAFVGLAVTLALRARIALFPARDRTACAAGAAPPSLARGTSRALPKVVQTDTSAFNSISGYFSWDHERLDQLLSELLRVVERSDLKHAEKAFGHYERGMRRHFHIEEDVVAQLYAFDRTGSAKGPTSTLQSEHARILEHIDEMGQAIGAHDAPAFRAAYARLNALLPAHNAKEERVLYPLIDSLLGAVEAERLVARLRAG